MITREDVTFHKVNGEIIPIYSLEYLMHFPEKRKEQTANWTKIMMNKLKTLYDTKRNTN